MAAKTERKRMLLDDKIVTLIERKGRKATIRDRFGFTKEVQFKELDELPDDSDLATFGFGDADD